MKQTMLLLGTAREGSTRVTDKMLRPFAGTTLFDIYLDRLERLWLSGFFRNWGVAVTRSDERLWAKAMDSSVPVIERDAQSASSEIQPRGRELHFLGRFYESHVCYVNACMPMFPDGDILSMVREFSCGDAVSITMRRAEHDWFYTEDGAPINNPDPHCLASQGCPPLLRAVHAANIYPRERMLSQNVRWMLEENDPVVHVADLTYWELMDVDTEDDFEACEREYIYRAGRSDVPCGSQSS